MSVSLEKPVLDQTKAVAVAVNDDNLALLTKTSQSTIPAIGTTNETPDIASLITKLALEDNNDLPFRFIDTVAGVSALIDVLLKQPTSPPSLYIDLEGVNLSREGTISILQIYVHPLSRTYLLDVHTLGTKLFSTQTASSSTTMKDILESSTIPKVFFDVRNDSDALFTHFGIRLAGIKDLQLMELATRYRNRKFVNGLARCIENDAGMSFREKMQWKETKEKGVKLFAPEKGGSYEVFNDRPLSIVIQEYCVQDVEFLPRLWSVYKAKMSLAWERKVDKAVLERIVESQSASYQPNGRHKAIGPW